VNVVWYELHFPSALDSDAVLRFARSFAVRARHGFLMSARPIICEIEGKNGQLNWRLGVTPGEHDQVLAGLRHALPDLRIEPIEHPASNSTASGNCASARTVGC